MSFTGVWDLVSSPDFDDGQMQVLVTGSIDYERVCVSRSSP
jgi:hypothetical protein